jgi:glutamine---fructose-6-phosphate transaminase (isomerizing)
MCGIVGIVGRTPVAWPIIEVLRRLQYRGYDSAGIATLEDKRLVRKRAGGKLINLEKRLEGEPLSGLIGIGHTRWATHGAPTENNAHPHATDMLAVVHNGIVENFRSLREDLEQNGLAFGSDTDTEVVAHLVTEEMRKGRHPVDAVESTLPRLSGAFALAFLFSGREDLIVAARKGSPLAVGYGEGETYVGSDPTALSHLTDRFSFLEDNDCAVLTRTSIEIHDARRRAVNRPIVKLNGRAAHVTKGTYRHFMAKEIKEQPEVIGLTLRHYLDTTHDRVALPEPIPFDLDQITRVSIVACGTAGYAGLVAKYWFGKLAKLPADVETASEFRYRDAPLSKRDLALFISQSGETADTLASLQYASGYDVPIISIVNVPNSSIARASKAVMPTFAGPEIGVASTKAFTCQLATLLCLVIAAGRARSVISETEERDLVRVLAAAPRHVANSLATEPAVQLLAHELSKYRRALYIGRGTNFPIALEGALKLKEISYIHAEGYAAGELKHGPIALVDEGMPVVVIAPYDHVFEKTMSNVQEIVARGGRIFLFTDDRGAEQAEISSGEVVVVPQVPPVLSPLIYAVPMQLLAYHTALLLGTDVDQPRNLAKSVTVE